VGNQQDLADGYEARALVIADSECIADCGPSLIAPADYARFTPCGRHRLVYAQIGLFWRGLPVLWWLAWPTGVSWARRRHPMWQA